MLVTAASSNESSVVRAAVGVTFEELRSPQSRPEPNRHRILTVERVGVRRCEVARGVIAGDCAVGSVRSMFLSASAVRSGADSNESDLRSALPAAQTGSVEQDT